MKKTIILGILSMFLLTSFNGVINAGEENTSDKIITAYSFESPVISKIDIDNTMYDSISIDGAPCGGNPGEPLLPGKGAYILLPPNSKVSNIIVNSGEMVCLGSGYLVEPAGEPVALSDMENAKVPTPDDEIYSSSDMFPGSFYSMVGTYRCRGYVVLVLKLHPVQYIPLTGELFYYPDLTVSVEIVEDNDFSFLLRGLEEDESDIVSKVDNPAVVGSYGINVQCQSVPVDLYDMVIITTDELKEGFRPLVLAHNATGVRTFIKTVEDIVSDSDYWVTGEWGDANLDNPFVENPIIDDLSRFNDTAAKVRNFIRGAYFSLGVDYVLLGADHDVIPAKILWNKDISWYGAIPSDLYYAGLDGTWNNPENPIPNNEDLSIDDEGVNGSGEGFLSGPEKNITDYVVGNSSMEWTITKSKFATGICKFTFDSPIDISGKKWLNFYLKSRGERKYKISKILIHSVDGQELQFNYSVFFFDRWEDRHFTISIPNNWNPIDYISIVITPYNYIDLGDVIMLDGIRFTDWDDTKWGEPGEDDLYAEVFVGRACVENDIEVDNFVNKTIKYMGTEPDDIYLKKVLMAGEYMGERGDGSWGGNLLDEIIDGSSNSGYTTIGIPSSDYIIEKLYDRDRLVPWYDSTIVMKINFNIHIINHCGHSDAEINMKLYTEDVYNLTNKKPSFIYSTGCLSGNFQANDCIAEYFTIKTNHGAFAGIWNTRLGYGSCPTTDGPSQRYRREFWDAVFGESKSEIGRANQDSKEDNIWRINEDFMRYVYYELTLFGDPAVDLLNHFQNNQPSKPDTPSGPTEGQTGVEYNYTTCTTDPDGHPVKYGWDWQGDFIVDEWTDFYPSGTPVTVSHSWPLPGPRWIRVKVIDIFGAKSEWSDPLTIILPINEQTSPSSQSSTQPSSTTTTQTITGSTTTSK